MEFRLLGPVEVEDRGRALPLSGRRQRAVLVHLLLSSGTPVPSGWLIEQVWGGDAPTAVRTSLHTYVSRLRAALGPERVETRSTGYVLHVDPEEVDARRFEQDLAAARTASAGDPARAAELYDAAIALRRGPALGDLADDPALQPEAARLEALHDVALVERIDVGLELEHAQALLPALEDVLLRHPLREDVWERYVRVLYRADRQADALAACERVRRLLRDEIGVEPGESLRRLHAQVLGHDPALTRAGAALHGYRLLDVVGEGPVWVVHRAVQPQVERLVALKVLRPHLAEDPTSLERVSAALHAAVSVEHPHVVPVHDVWCAPGSTGVVERLVRGGTLARPRVPGVLHLARAVELTVQLAGAIDASWRAGLPVRRLTADDVLLDLGGRAYLSCTSPTRTSASRRDDTGGTPAVPLGQLLLRVWADVPGAPPELQAALSGPGALRELEARLRALPARHLADAGAVRGR